MPILLLLLPILILLPKLNYFAYPASGSPYSDITVTHYPNAVFLLRALHQWDVIPLWSPTIMSGYPFFAHPLNGLYYPPGWLAYLFPLPFGFNLMMALHLAWGGLGMYFLMKAEGLFQHGALLAGLAFACLPKFFAHFGAGHLTLLYAIPWTTWLLVLQTATHKKLADVRWWRKYLPGIIFGLILLADIRWGPIAGLVSISYDLAHSQVPRIRTRLLKLINQTLVALLISAPLLLPLLEYTRLSTRGQLTVEESLIFSLPFLRLFDLFIPDLTEHHEWVFYAGGIATLFTLVALITHGRGRSKKYWISLVLAGLIFSTGANLPGMKLVYELPGMDLLRVPSRALFLVGMGMSALAGLGFDRVLVGLGDQKRRKINLGMVGLITLSSGLSIGLYLVTGSSPKGTGLGLLILFIGAFWIVLKTANRVPVRYWVPGIFLLAILEWSTLSWYGISWRSTDDVIAEGGEAARYLALQGGIFRVYSPSYSIPQYTAALNELELADGVDPMQLESYVALIEKASGVPNQGYSVTIPQFAGGDPKTDNQRYLPDPRLLGLLNVRYVVSSFDIAMDGLELEQQFEGTRIYRNLFAMARAWVQDLGTEQGMEIRPAEIAFRNPNRIEIKALGPGTLVVSEISYPGWQAWVDGKPQEIQAYKDLLRSVPLEPGEHTVRFSFQPTSLYAGFALWGVALLSIIVWIFARWISHKLVSS